VGLGNTQPSVQLTLNQRAFLQVNFQVLDSFNKCPTQRRKYTMDVFCYFRYLQQMRIVSCFRFELSFSVDTIINRLLCNVKMRDRLRNPRVIAAVLMVKESKHSPRLPDSTVNWDSLSILIMISDKQRRAKFTLILFTERRHVGRGGIIHLKRNQCNYLGFETIYTSMKQRQNANTFVFVIKRTAIKLELPLFLTLTNCN